MRTQLRRDTKWRNCFNSSIQSISSVFPTQQRDVAAIVNTASGDPNIQKLIVFGSSVTCLCNPWSDIDIYVELEENLPIHLYSVTVEAPLDIWTNFTVDKSDDLFSEIMQKGVVVYDRGNLIASC